MTTVRPVPRILSAALVISAIIAVSCGGAILADRLRHHARTRLAIRPEWLAPPMAGREVAKLRHPEDRP